MNAPFTSLGNVIFTSLLTVVTAAFPNINGVETVPVESVATTLISNISSLESILSYRTGLFVQPNGDFPKVYKLENVNVCVLLSNVVCVVEYTDSVDFFTDFETLA